jgi:hypothetical protein
LVRTRSGCRPAAPRSDISRRVARRAARADVSIGRRARYRADAVNGIFARASLRGARAHSA